jgi:uncharacterized ion transporter superfamily protein YfcC
MADLPQGPTGPDPAAAPDPHRVPLTAVPSAAPTPTELAPAPPLPEQAWFKAPDATIVISLIIVLAALLTWVVPPGAFDTREIQVEGVGTRDVVIPGSFHPVEREVVGLWPRVRHTVGMVFLAPILGFIDEEAVPIIAFVFLIGGAFAVLAATGAIESALRRVVQASRGSERVRTALIPAFMVLFSLGGGIFGMSEETIPFVLIFVPLALALGYDSLTGIAIPFLGAAAGFAGAFLNPFTVGVAQGIAGVPLFSGWELRLWLWTGSTLVTVAFVMWHAARVRRDPAKSATFALDEVKRSAGLHLDGAATPLTGRQKAVLGIFFGGIALLVWGVLPASRGGQGWYINEIAALFVAMGVAMGLVGGLGADRTAKAFMEGFRDFAPTAILIALARGIIVVLHDGQVIDPILNAAAGLLDGAGDAWAAQAMFAVQTGINFFVASGSAQAALTMPIMAPLSDLLGVSRQTAVLAYQMGDGYTNTIIPTSAVLMGALSLGGVPWTTWFRWILPLQAALYLFGIAMLFVAVAVGY